MPNANGHDPRCTACGAEYRLDGHPTCYESVYLMLHVCPACIGDYIRRHGTSCVNCGGAIVPHSQVAVYKGDRGEPLYGHVTVACNPAGNSFYGYWGRGRLESAFGCIEMC
jgi:hypothetical protein